MLTRIISGAIIFICILAMVIPGGYVLLGTTCIIAMIGFHELYHALSGTIDIKKPDSFEVVGLVGVAAWYASIHFFGIALESLCTIMAVLFLEMGLYVFRFPKFKCERAIESVFAFIYCPVLLSFIYLTRELPHGIWFVWLIFISSWISDTGAYFFGRALGKHKLAPVLSPKKSVEGAVAGVLSAALIGGIYGLVLKNMGFLTLPYQITMFAVIGGVGSILSQLGDLCASGFKRDRGVKDYGKLIPGHGGIMDRFDSVIVTSPIIFALTFYLFPLA
ncbi:MAG: phosphatidate cytidylyltransferase [Lachnospiraceae bacterium]|nr:phosphatidate cytidylyltransferase [Candidatus Merdinaster equi]